MIEGMLWLLVGASWAYWLVAWWAARRFFRGSFKTSYPSPPAPLPQGERGVLAAASSGFTPPVSLLKPVKGIDADAYENFSSFCRQDYPAYELVFGVSRASDPAVTLVERLKREFPQRRIRLVVARGIGANPKSGMLEQLVREADHEHLVISDADIRVAPDYLRRVVAPFEDRQVGMVTCPYRSTAAGRSTAGLESLFLDLNFLPSAIVAHTLGIPLGLGATIAVRRADLSATGGYAQIADYLSDDYLVAARIAGLGRNVVLSDCVVTNVLGRGRLRDEWDREVRWARGIRVLRPCNYLGLALTFSTPLAIGVAIAGGGAMGLAAVAGSLALRWRFALRMWDYLGQPRSWRGLAWLPLRDLLTAAVWCFGSFGKHVIWRGTRFELLPDNRLRPAPARRPLRRALAGGVRRFDAWLRGRQGIFEFTDDDECLFRLSLARAAGEVRLADGTRIAPDEPIVELHFWNEHLPAVPREGPGLAWGKEFARRLSRSLDALARYLEQDHRLADIQAVYGVMPLVSRNDRRLLLRAQRYLGVEFLDAAAPRGLLAALHAWGRRLHLWGLIWAFSPGGLKGLRLERQWRPFWISRATLLGRLRGRQTASTPSDLVCLPAQVMQETSSSIDIAS